MKSTVRSPFDIVEFLLLRLEQKATELFPRALLTKLLEEEFDLG